MVDDTKTCPDCAETVKAAAKKCRYCGFAFNESSSLEKATAVGAQAATAAAEKALSTKLEQERALANGEKPKFRWMSGKGCLILLGIFFGLLILIGTISRLADPEGYAAQQKQRQEEKEAEEALEVAKKADELAAVEEDKRKGFHCLSKWDGSNLSTEQQVEAMLRDPDSFEHVETRISPLDETTGEHGLWMTYRAKNGFGGVNVERIYARVNTDTCNSRLLPNGPGSE